MVKNLVRTYLQTVPTSFEQKELSELGSALKTIWSRSGSSALLVILICRPANVQVLLANLKKKTSNSSISEMTMRN